MLVRYVLRQTTLLNVSPRTQQVERLVLSINEWGTTCVRNLSSGLGNDAQSGRFEFLRVQQEDVSREDDMLSKKPKKDGQPLSTFAVAEHLLFPLEHDMPEPSGTRPNPSKLLRVCLKLDKLAQEGKALCQW